MDINVVAMEINYESLELMTKYGLAMLGILFIIFLIAVATPHLAKLFKKNPERVDKNNDGVHDIYDVEVFPENEKNDEN